MTTLREIKRIYFTMKKDREASIDNDVLICCEEIKKIFKKHVKETMGIFLSLPLGSTILQEYIDKYIFLDNAYSFTYDHYEPIFIVKVLDKLKIEGFRVSGNKSKKEDKHSYDINITFNIDEEVEE